MLNVSTVELRLFGLIRTGPNPAGYFNVICFVRKQLFITKRIIKLRIQNGSMICMSPIFGLCMFTHTTLH